MDTEEAVTPVQYITYYDFAKGLYQKGLELLNVGNPEDDYSVISGCILLSIGLEKLIKSALEKKNPLMILRKIDFKDVNDVTDGKKLPNGDTVTLFEAYQRLLKAYPNLPDQENIIDKIRRDRNQLVHNAGQIIIGKIEKRIRVNVTEISETICLTCLEISPIELFGKYEWDVLKKYRDSYQNDSALEFDERIKFYKRLYEQGESLPCKNRDNRVYGEIEYECPICGEIGIMDIDRDSIFSEGDHHGNILRKFVYFIVQFYCSNCNFSITDYNDLTLFIGSEEEEAELISNWESDRLDGYYGE